MRLVHITLIALLVMLACVKTVDAKPGRKADKAARKADKAARKQARKQARARRKQNKRSYIARKRKKKDLLSETSGLEEDDDDATCLMQSDFSNGTKIITEPGVYKLCEDIVFDPNAPTGDRPDEDAYDPVFPGPYNENTFGLGFFAALAIATSDVEIHLNDHSIEQSPGHCLFQRYFAVIELADSPFIKGAGPAQFIGEGMVCTSASNIKIKGPGTIGRSSHHGIHGNDNYNVTIENVIFDDFEVAAVSLNNVDGLVIQDCTVVGNRQDVPVTGMFSAARFIRPYGKALKEMDFSMKLRGVETSAALVYDNLIESINNVWEDVIAKPKKQNGRIHPVQHKTEYDLFHNEFETIDGPCYAFVVHGKGPAVGGQGLIFDEMDNMTSSNIVIKNNDIGGITCWTKEIPAVVEEGTVLNDPRGAVFQVVDAVNYEGISINLDGTYRGNVVADMQIMVAKAIAEGLLEDEPNRQIGPNSISETLITWAENESGEETLNPSFRCNGDAMMHVSKGTVVIRVEDTEGFIIEGNKISMVKNVSPPPFTNCFDYHPGASDENEGEQQGGNVRGISVAAVRGFTGKHSTIKGNTVKKLNSENANVIIGIDVQGDSKAVEIENNFVDLNADAGVDVMDQFISLRLRENTDGQGDDAIMLGENELIQDHQVLNNRRKLRKELKHPHGERELEWKVGGCPFARAKGQMRK